MSVPLDRLYNFLHDLCNHDDVLIYRFFPHGSKNFRDCSPIVSLDQDIVKSFTARRIVCHDQEPLNRQFYKNISSRIMHRLIDKKIFLYDKVLLLHSEKNSPETALFEQEDAISVYWWSHALIARDWFRYASIDPKLLQQAQPTHDFLIYNRAWGGTREYRLYFAELISNTRLLTNCLMNFSTEDNGIDYREHQFENSKFQIVRRDLERYFRPNTATACYSADYDSNDYAKTRVEIVLETLFDDTRWHLTEKTLRPIACGKPFILAATPGSLDYIRSYGFKTFSPWIDESYDTETDPVLRLKSIVLSMRKFSALPADEKNQASAEMQEICNHNRQRFFSQEFLNDVVTEFQKNISNGLEELEHHKSKDFRRLMRGFGSVEKASVLFSRQELVQIWKKAMSNQEVKEINTPSQSASGGFSL